MTTVGEVYQALDAIAPFSLAEDWDNVGLLIGSGEQQVGRILMALDITDSVINEAVEWRAGAIVTHHPIIFSPMKKIQADSLVYRLIQNGISVISAHTNLDIAQGGVNDVLAQTLGLENIRPLQIVSCEPYYKVVVMVPVLQAEEVYQAMAKAGAGTLGNYSGCGFMSRGEGRFVPQAGASPYLGSAGKLEKVDEIRLEMLTSPETLKSILEAMKHAHPYEEPAYDVLHNYGCQEEQALGRVGDLAAPMTPQDLAESVKMALQVDGLKYVPGSKEIRTVAVCGGSGADFLWKAKAAGAQALVTGESKHHLLLEAARLGITLIDAGHFATETVVLESLQKQLEARLPGIPVRISAANGDGVCYL